MQSLYAIKLDHPEFGAYITEAGHPLKALEHLGRVNLFVGANNSGKSRMLRRLASAADYAVKFDADSMFRIGQDVRRILNDTRHVFTSKNCEAHGRTRLLDVTAAIEKETEFVQLGSSAFPLARALFESMLSAAEGDSQSFRGHAPDAGSFARALRHHGKQGLDLLKSESLGPTTKPERLYLPVLRGLRRLREDSQAFTGSATDYYLLRTRADYFKEEKSPPQLFTGATLYEDVRKLLLGYHRDRQQIVDYQRFLSLVFFDRQDVILVPHVEDDVLYVKIGDEQDRPIYSLGDGIQQAIILSFLPFTATKPTFFFIEEPELHMHPGMQRKLLDFYVEHERCKQHHFFITTHSNHLLDMTADYETVAVINFRKRLKAEATAAGDKEPEFVVQPMDAGDESILLDLGVRNSSVFLVNATIWVEGITDRLYMRRFLELYQEAHAGEAGFVRIQEDVHFAVVEYGGGNVTHFFLDDDESPSITLNRVCGKVFLLIDEDGLGKQERKDKLQRAVGGCFAMTPGREIENLLPLSVIHAVISEFEQKKGGTAPQLPAKPKPHRKAKLGDYIHQEVFKGSGWRRPGGYRAESGTIKGKVDFCHRAIEKLTRFEDLSSEVQALIRRIHGFVVEKNG